MNSRAPLLVSVTAVFSLILAFVPGSRAYGSGVDGFQRSEPTSSAVYGPPLLKGQTTFSEDQDSALRLRASRMLVDEPAGADLRMAISASSALSRLQADAQNVELVGYVAGSVEAVFLNGDYVYIGDGPQLVIFDVANPAAPSLLGSTEPLSDTVKDVYVANDYAYVATGEEGGLHVVDVSNPIHPIQISFYNTPYSSFPGIQVQGLAVSGETAFVVDVFGLHRVDVSDPANPSTLSTTETPGAAYDVTLDGSITPYVADGSAGLLGPDGSYDTPGTAYNATISGHKAYVADGATGLQIVDIRDPSNLAGIGSYDTPNFARDVGVSGSRAYVADGFGGLRVVDVSDPSAPLEVGSYTTHWPGYACDISVNRDTAYLANGDGGLLILRYTGGLFGSSISGRVTDAYGAGIEEVMVRASGGGGATTDALGAYTINNVLPGFYILAASRTGYEFSPTVRVVSVPPDATNQDFTTTALYGCLAGRITDQASGAGVGSARVSAAGRVVRSDANGDYTLPNLLPGSHNVYVSADGYEDYKGQATIEADITTGKDVALTPMNESGYYLPYPGGRTYQCTQGNDGAYSHQGNWYYAFDFGMPDGHHVVASRGGRVVAVKDDSNSGCGSSACIDQANYVRVMHDDGTDTLYYHLKYSSAIVQEGDFVARGDVIAQSNTTGWCTGPHLDFTRHNWGQWKSISVSFADVPVDGVPKTGGSYTSGNYPTSQSLIASEETVDLDPPLGSVQLRFSGQPTHTLVLSAFDYRTDVSHMRLAATEQKLQTASWTPFITRTTWTDPAVFAQYSDASGNVSAVVSDTLDAIGYEPLQAAFVVSSTVCVDQELPLTNQTTPFCEQCDWLWDFGDGTTSKGAEPVFGYLGASSFAGYEVPGAYSVTLTVKNATNAVSVSQQVEALARPSADFTLIRSGDAITVEAAATDAAGWAWDFGDGVTATGRIATHTYADMALMRLYPVQLLVEGANSCTSWSHQYIPPHHVYLPLVLRDY